MNQHHSPLYWSFSVGSYFGTQVRISVFFPLIILVLGMRFGWTLGAVFSVVLFASVLLHEMAGHILAARLTGGYGNEVLLWPLGGLAFVQPAETFSSQFLTAAAGPLVNLTLCGLTFFAAHSSPYWPEAISPLVMPPVDFSVDALGDVLLLVFAANWLMLLINLIPIFPLDGGQMLKTCLAQKWDRRMVHEIYVRVGFVVSFIMMIVGLMYGENGSVSLVFFGSILLVLNMQESIQAQSGDSYDESFLGYDFSQGYTSLEQAESKTTKQPGAIQRWKEKRRRKKQAKNRERERADELAMDAILEKVHTQGRSALSAAEEKILNRASVRLRNKGDSQDR